MKLSISITLICLIAFNFSAVAQKNPFVGTWKLVAGEYLNEKKELISYQNLGIQSQKVITNTHFSFVSTAKGKFWAAGTGSFSFTDSEYIEKPTMASYPLEDNGIYTFQYVLIEGQWHNSRWHGDTRVEYEVWQRVQ